RAASSTRSAIAGTSPRTSRTCRPRSWRSARPKPLDSGSRLRAMHGRDEAVAAARGPHRARASTAFVEALARGTPVVLDGGLATQLEAQGHDLGTALWSAALLRSDPEAIAAAHRAFLEAGAECITSASYQASRTGFTWL